VGLVRRIQPTAEIIAELVEQAVCALEREAPRAGLEAIPVGDRA
jgi:hypothetical protein